LHFLFYHILKRINIKLTQIIINQMNSYKTAARIVGALFLISTAGYIVGNLIIDSLRHDPNYLTIISKNETQMITGVILMLVNCFAVVGIAIVMFPILKRHNENIALVYLSSRIIESIVLIFGVISYLSLLTISKQYIKLNADDVSYFKALGVVAMNGNYYSFQIGMISLSIGSSLFCYLLYQSKLVPRFFAVWGIIGYVALFIGTITALYGYDISVITFVPVGLFEIILPIWLIFKGFNPRATVPISIKTDMA